MRHRRCSEMTELRAWRSQGHVSAPDGSAEVDKGLRWLLASTPLAPVVVVEAL